MKICSISKCNYTLEKIVENDVKIDIENLKPSREEKRAIIVYRLKNNFPMLIVLFFAIAFILIGVAAIGLEIVLIEKKALNYHLANGIWGGVFSILNGLLKANLIIWKNYSSYIFSELFTPFVAIVSSVGLSILCVYNLKEYAKCVSISSCTPLNQNLTITMLVLGLIALHLNFFFAFHFKMGLFGSWKRVRAQSVGFFEAFRELCHLWTSFF